MGRLRDGADALSARWPQAWRALFTDFHPHDLRGVSDDELRRTVQRIEAVLNEESK